MEQLNVKEGLAPFNGMQTWYRITGDLSSAQTPLVVAHGGPGCTHDYVLSIAKIAEFGRPVIHYDQVGNGKSTRLTDKGPEFFTVDLFLDELNNLVEHLGIADNYFLLGQSWGGMLGAEHGIRQPQGLKGLIISNSPASMELWASEAKVLRSKLPADVRDTLDRHEANGTMDDPEYVAAADKFYAEHVCRVVPNPPEVVATFECMRQDNHVYLTMNGPYEYYCVGTLKDWTVVDEVHKITAPTLLVSGRYDEATPATVQPFFDNIPDVQWEIFEESSHMPFVEETDRYMQVVEEFMAAHDH
jgi:L-proline amide hydrolase